MKAQNIMSQAVSGFAGMAKDAAAKKTSAVSEDNQFSSVMNRNMKKDNDVSDAPQSEQNVSGTKVNNQKPLHTNQPEETAEDTADTAADTQTVDGTGEETDVSVQEAVAAIQEEIKQNIKDITGITEEELAEILSQYNLTVTDLLDFSSLQQFVVAVNGGEDVSVLLTDETAAGQFAELYEQLKDLAEMMQPFVSDETAAMDTEASPELLAAQEIITEDSLVMPKDTGDKKVFADAMDAAGEMTDNAQADAPVITVEAEESYNFSGSSTEGDEEFAGTQTDVAKEQADVPQMKESPAAVFAQNLANAANQVHHAAPAAESHVQQMMDIVNQVVEQVKIILKPDTTSMDMMLNPESLGRLQLTVESKGGVMTASFTVQNEVAKEAIESQIQVLREQLEEKDLKVDAVEVNVSDFDFEGSSMAQGEAEKQGSRQSSANSRRLLHLVALEETEEALTEEEELAVEVMKQNGSSIDFTA